MFWLWVGFVAVAAVVVYSGSRLTFHADVIAEKTGMGRTWAGVILLATMTSLPELITGASAITAVDGPDIAIADVLGSCVFNLAIIAILDLLYRPGVILSKAEQGHILAAGFGLLMLVVAAIGIFLAQQGVELNLFWIGLYTPAIIYVYLRGIRTIFRFEKTRMRKDMKAAGISDIYAHQSKKAAYRGFAVHAFIIVVSASLLPFIGNEIALETGWGQTFVGLLFVALATSLPEVTTSISALRRGAIDLAIGGLLGSNLFNLAILAFDDVIYTKGPILAHISVTNLLPALSAILMSVIAILTLFYQPKTRRLLRITWLAILIFSIYALNTFAVFYLETR